MNEFFCTSLFECVDGSIVELAPAWFWAVFILFSLSSVFAFVAFEPRQPGTARGPLFITVAIALGAAVVTTALLSLVVRWFINDWREPIVTLGVVIVSGIVLFIATKVRDYRYDHR